MVFDIHAICRVQLMKHCTATFCVLNIGREILQLVTVSWVFGEKFYRWHYRVLGM